MTIVSLITGLDRDSSRSTMKTIDSRMTREEMDMAATVDAVQETPEISTATRIEITTTTTNDVVQEVDHLKEHDLAHLAVVLRRAGNMASDLKESKSRLVGMYLPYNQMQQTSDAMASPSTTDRQYARFWSPVVTMVVPSTTHRGGRHTYQTLRLLLLTRYPVIYRTRHLRKYLNLNRHHQKTRLYR